VRLLVRVPVAVRVPDEVCVCVRALLGVPVRVVVLLAVCAREKGRRWKVWEAMKRRVSGRIARSSIAVTRRGMRRHPPLTSDTVGVGDQLPVLDGVLPSDTDAVGVGLAVRVCVRVLVGVPVLVRVLDGVAVCELVKVRLRVRDADQPTLTVADCRRVGVRGRKGEATQRGV
jgi:hypothetical protein